MKRCKYVLTLAAVALIIQAGMAFPAMSDEKKTDVKPAATKAKTGNKAAADKNAVVMADASSKKVAIVNGTPIFQSDLNEEMEEFIHRRVSSGAAMNESQLENIRVNTLNNLIIRELLNQECEKQKIVITDDQVKDNLMKIKQKLKENMAFQILIDKQVVEKINVSEQEAHVYYDAHPDAFKQPEQIKASHILVKVEPKDDPGKKEEAHKKIELVKEKLKAGGDFAALAKEFSDDSSKDNRGGSGIFFKRTDGQAL